MRLAVWTSVLMHPKGDNAFKSAKLKLPQVPNVKVAELTKLIKGLNQEQFARS